MQSYQSGPGGRRGRGVGVETLYWLPQRFTPHQLSKDNRPIDLPLFWILLHAKVIRHYIHVFKFWGGGQPPRCLTQCTSFSSLTVLFLIRQRHFKIRCFPWWPIKEISPRWLPRSKLYLKIIKGILTSGCSSKCHLYTCSCSEQQQQQIAGFEAQ